MAGRDDVERLRAERDLYRRLLELGRVDALESFLREALSLVVEVARARKGYLEVREAGGDPDARVWSIAHGCAPTEVDAFRRTLSSGIIAEAVSRGETVRTASALDDPRFRDRPSVAAQKIEAVLCAPIGTPVPFGVVYLQGRDARGAFPDEDRERTELFARHAAPYAERLMTRQLLSDVHDPTQTWRRRLEAEEVVGRSRALAEVLRLVSIAAPTRISVLLTGPSGTGKSQLARLIHGNSPRRDKAFVELNCGAIPEGIVESELFGALRGSFSGATRRIRGKVEAAEGGTLFLDEVGELPPAVQVKLLNLLQSGTFYQVGNEQPSQADIRVIAATNLDIEEAVTSRRFREDLYHRLNVVRIELPGLTERREDIVPLARSFAARTCTQYGYPELGLSPGACLSLRAADWPGNVRELANKVEWAVIQAAAEEADTVGEKHLFGEARDGEPDEAPRTWHEATRRYQAKLLKDALRECRGNRSEAARQLGISRGYLYEAMRSLGVEGP